MEYVQKNPEYLINWHFRNTNYLAFCDLVDDWQAKTNKFKRIMIIIDRKDGENIDRMLRRYKRKHRDVKLRRELRNRKQFEKPSDVRRKEVLKAIYRDQKIQNEEL